MRSLVQPNIEVMAEIGFTTLSGEALPGSAGKHLFSKLKGRYPNFERATDVQLQVEMRDDIEAIEARCDRVSHRFLYRAHPPAVVIQVSPQAVQLHFSGPYVGWERVADIVEREWTTAAKTLGLRLGDCLMLRFVVHLPLMPSRQSLAYWLRSNIYMPEAMRHTNQGYQSRVELTDPATDVQTSVCVAPVVAPMLDAMDIKPIGVEVTVRQDLSHRVARKHVVRRLELLHSYIQNIYHDALAEPSMAHLKFAGRQSIVAKSLGHEQASIFQARD